MSLDFECKKCHKYYPQNLTFCPICGTRKGANKPPYVIRTQRITFGGAIAVVALIFGFIVFQFSQYCDQNTGECGINAHIAALQATSTPDATQTFDADARATSQAYATSTERVQLALTEFAYNSMVASTNVAATRTAEPTMTAMARNVNATMTSQASTINNLESANIQMGATATAVARIRPNHFIADAVNSIAYATYDNAQLPLFIEDGIIILLVFCAGGFFLMLIGGVIGAIGAMMGAFK